MTAAEKRRRDREAKRREAFRDWVRAIGDSKRCPRMYGHLRCNGLIELRTDGMGSVIPVCLLCERKARGICRACSSGVDGELGRAIWCRPHKLAHKRAAALRYKNAHRDELNEKARAFARREREKRCAYKREWRKRNPAKVKMQKRRAALSGRAAETHRRWCERNPDKVKVYAERAKAARQARKLVRQQEKAA